MNLSEAKARVRSAGYVLLKEEEMSEQEFLDSLRDMIMAKAEEENFNVNSDELEAVMFEVYDYGYDLNTAVEKVWNAVYVDDDAVPQEIE